MVTSELHEALADARARTRALVAHLDPHEFEHVVTPILSPLAWDLGHIAAYEDLWINHRLGGMPLLRPGLAELYDAFETPRPVRGSLEYLRGEDLWRYLAEVRERAVSVEPGDGLMHELVVRHENQHNETMLQAMAMARRLPGGWGVPAPGPGGDAHLDLVVLPAATAAVGARTQDGFSYDNERPRHERRVGAFAIARRPVTNAAWLAWAGDGGYERREWWSAEGWEWLAKEDVADRTSAPEGDPHGSVMHVSWYEADAFARALGARLPTEHEWERAAAAGALQGVGDVWEWTCSPFGAYPGFIADPYREYSEVFFGDEYRVLRGWSCVTAERVASTTFRNWDLPQRRQLFSGLRLARDC